jgi:HEAT repeat protein
VRHLEPAVSRNRMARFEGATVTGDQASIERTPHRVVDYTGRAIGPLRLARAMLVNVVGGCCILAALAVLWPNAAATAVFLQESLGATKTQNTLNLALVSLASIAGLPGAWLFSRFQRRKPLWVPLTAVSRAFMLGAVGVALLSGDSHYHGLLIAGLIFCLVMVNGGTTFTSPGWWSWMGDLIPETILGRFFGQRYRWMLLVQSLVAVTAGWLLDRAGNSRFMFAGIFLVAALAAVIDPLLFTLVPEPARPKPGLASFGSVAREYLAVIRDKAFQPLLISSGAYAFFFNLPLLLIVLFLRGESRDGVWIGGHAPMWVLSLVLVVFALGTALAASQWGRLADRIGHRIVWILGSVGYVTYASFFFINQHNYAWIALLSQALFGILFAGQPVAVQNLALSMAPAKKREYYISVFQMGVAVSAGAGALFGGWLADRYPVFPSIILPSGQPACYIHLVLLIAFAGMLASLPVMIRVPDPKGSEVWPWFGRLLSGDLLRVAWNISVLGTPSSTSRRARALRRISQRDGNVMLPEISSALGDPGPELRREALFALGRLGTPEALDLLRWYLYEPDAVMRAQSVEAIGQARVPDLVNLLKQRLRDPDSRVRRAAAGALGASGDQSAAEELRALLAGEIDGDVIISVAMSLSQLRIFEAVHEMIGLALNSGNTTVRSQMVVALADLLGGTSDFQKLWRRDRHWRGSGFAILARKLRKQARVLVRWVGPGKLRAHADRKRLVAAVDAEVEAFLEQVQSESWRGALKALRVIAMQFLVLRYRYHGDEEHALEFLSAVAPDRAQRYWLIGCLQDACESGSSPEAPWDGLTLLGAHVLVHG